MGNSYTHMYIRCQTEIHSVVLVVVRRQSVSERTSAREHQHPLCRCILVLGGLSHLHNSKHTCCFRATINNLFILTDQMTILRCFCCPQVAKKIYYCRFIHWEERHLNWWDQTKIMIMYWFN